MMNETPAARIARELRSAGRDHPHNTLEDTVSELLDRGVISAGPHVLACECGHSGTLHDIRANGVRGRCGFLAGPRGIQCPCIRFRGTG